MHPTSQPLSFTQTYPINHEKKYFCTIFSLFHSLSLSLGAFHTFLFGTPEKCMLSSMSACFFSCAYFALIQFDYSIILALFNVIFFPSPAITKCFYIFIFYGNAVDENKIIVSINVRVFSWVVCNLFSNFDRFNVCQ